MKRKIGENMAGNSSSHPYIILDDENMAANSSCHPYIIVDDNEDDDDVIILFSDDERYAQELQLQEALLCSRNISLTSSSSSSSSSKHTLLTSPESSKLPDSFCAICMDTKKSFEMFRNPSVCGHLFCSDCIREHVAAKIKENQTKVKCPDPSCKGVIGPEVCRSIVPKQVLDRWENILCESLIMERDKFYCPFKDCSALMVNDGGVAVTSSECPSCNRLFCAQCKVAWHCGMDCNEFRRLKKDERNPEDIVLMNLAKVKKWKRCPKCNFFVEKASGCWRVVCRCGNGFCYACGKSCISYNHSCARG